VLWVRRRLPLAAAVALSFLLNAVIAGDATAHVKWFCAYDVAGAPQSLESVLCPDFEFLIGLSILWLTAGCMVEWSVLAPTILRALDRATVYIRDNTELMFRVGCAFFFVAIWSIGGILLTPELKTSSVAVGAIQLGIAAGMLSRRTMPLSALGIAVIFAIAVWNYGVFHLADYPVFLGVAAYLGLTGLQRDLFGARALDIVRWSAGVTLMWASIEKWAYPQWSFPLLVEHPGMTMGFDAEFFMRAAGAVEFVLAFALIWTPLVRRLAATVLLGMFISAIFQFGKIDLIGHSLIIVVLFAILADNRAQTALVRYPWLAPIGYAAALGIVMMVYYLGHAELYGTPIT
jgi:hypothetical protein